MKQTKFKEVAHLYLGCTVETHPDFRPNRKERIEGKPGFAKLTENLLADEADGTFPFRLKPLLYPFSAFTEDQTRAWFKIANDHISDVAEIDDRMVTNATNAIRKKGIASVYFDSDDTESSNLIPYLINFLLAESYDLFGLIETGEAIDATTLV